MIAEEHSTGKTNKQVAANSTSLFPTAKAALAAVRSKDGQHELKKPHTTFTLSTQHKAFFWIQTGVQVSAVFKTDQGTGGAEDLPRCSCFEEGIHKGQDKKQGH